MGHRLENREYVSPQRDRREMPTPQTCRYGSLPPQEVDSRENLRRGATMRRRISRLHLTMRLSDAEVRPRQTEMLDPNHRPPPWLTEDATRDRSNRLLDALPRAIKGRESSDGLTRFPMNFIRYYPDKFRDHITLRWVEEPNALPPIWIVMLRKMVND